MQKYYTKIYFYLLIAWFSTTLFQMTGLRNNIFVIVPNTIVHLICFFMIGWLFTYKTNGTIVRASLMGLLFIFYLQVVYAGTISLLIYYINATPDGLINEKFSLEIFLGAYLAFFIIFCTIAPIAMIASAMGGYFGIKSKAKNSLTNSTD